MDNSAVKYGTSKAVEFIHMWHKVVRVWVKEIYKLLLNQPTGKKYIHDPRREKLLLTMKSGEVYKTAKSGSGHNRQMVVNVSPKRDKTCPTVSGEKVERNWVKGQSEERKEIMKIFP